MIPKIIHQIWHEPVYDGADGTPQSWKDRNPGWDYRHWTFQDLSRFVHAEFPQYAELFDNNPFYHQKSDIGRLLLLGRFGGVYADMDTDCLASFDAIAADDRVIVAEEPKTHHALAHRRGMQRLFMSAILAGPAGHPFWAYAMEVVARCRHATMKDPCDATGPLALTGAIESYPDRDGLALHSCHLFSPFDSKGNRQTDPPAGPYRDLVLARHNWAGAWVEPSKPTFFATAKGKLRKWNALARRPSGLTLEEARKSVSAGELLAPAPAYDPDDPPNVAIFVPVRDGAPFIARNFELVSSLDYPREKIRIAYCEGDSSDDSNALLKAVKAEHEASLRGIDIVEFSTGYAIPRRNRWKMHKQFARRRNIARVRNRLVAEALRDDDEWVLWLDVDVTHFDPGVLRRLLAANGKIVTPDCVLEPGGTSFDWNAFLDVDEPPEAAYFKHMRYGLFQPPVTYPYRRVLHDLRYLDKVPLTGVGGTMLLVHASVHRSGLPFPEKPYRDMLETEGFGRLANDLGLTPYGLPNVEIVHVNS